MKLIAAAVIALFSAAAAAQADRFDKVEIKTTQLTRNIYLLQGEGGNIGVSYVMWVRSLAAIWLLHLLLNHRRAHSQEDSLLPAGQMRTVSVP